MLRRILLALAASTSLVGGVSLERRTGQTTAICAAEFQWMSNKAGDSPCLVAAKLGDLCNPGNWDIPSILGPDGKANNTYTNPSVAKNTANVCTCSWSYYNLISACTACQGASYYVSLWPAYKSNCSGLESTTFFPSGFTFPPSLTVPFWAGQDPTKWTNQQFDTNAAQQLDNQGHDDLTLPPPTQAKKKTNVGAIAGGVIGGLVVIAAAIAIAIIIIRRNKARATKHQQMQYTGGSGTVNGHMRSFSDATQKSDLSTGPHIYSTFTSTPMYTNAPTSPTIQTHPMSTSSGRSLPFLTSLMGGTASPPPQGGNISRQQTPPVNREDILVPYTEAPNGRQFNDRKHPGGPGIVYDHPDAPPPNAPAIRMEIVRPATPPRARLNPPPYIDDTSSPGTSTGPSSHRPVHTKKGSADTNHSMTSSVPRSPANTVTPVNPLAIYNPSSPPPPPENSSQEQSSGRQLSGPSRDTKRQSPQSDSFYGGDLA